MRRTKGQNVKSSSIKLRKDVHTQTSETDDMIEIARLEEQVKLLQLENDILKKYAINKEKCVSRVSDVRKSPRTEQTIEVVPQNNSNGIHKGTDRGCACKGNCSSKLCGCMKKQYKCREICKCNVATCQNQASKVLEMDKENDGDTNNRVHSLDVEKRSPLQNKQLNIKKGGKGLFSPDIQAPEIPDSTDEYPKKQKKKENKIFDSMTHATTSYQNTYINEIKNEDNIDNTNDLENLNFNPMEPKCQLPRTPPRSSTERSYNNISDIVLPNPQEEKKPENSVIEVLNQPEVNWEQHKAELVGCRKCKRKYFPHRIKIHERCCKNV